MALTIGEATVTSDRSAHTAVLLPGARHTWVVSWLPGRPPLQEPRRRQGPQGRAPMSSGNRTARGEAGREPPWP